MFPTTEIRWFFSGKISQSITGSPALQALFTAEPLRIDWYLQPGSAQLGIKVREGRVEVKRRIGQLGSLSGFSQAAGIIEQWVKWSFSADAAEDVIAADPRHSWIPVEKRRRTACYNPEWDVPLRPPVAETLATSFCRLEVTAVRAAGEYWWSLGLEADGLGHDRGEDVIPAALRALFRRQNFPTLPAAASFGYAHWLVELHRKA